MLSQNSSGAIVESYQNNCVLTTSGGIGSSSALDWPYNCTTYYYQSYPVYVCTDKTKKAIEVLKALEKDGLKVTSVPKFIALVEKIAGLL